MQRVRWQENMYGTTFLPIHVNNVVRLILLSWSSIITVEKKELSARWRLEGIQLPKFRQRSINAQCYVPTATED